MVLGACLAREETAASALFKLWISTHLAPTGPWRSIRRRFVTGLPLQTYLAIEKSLSPTRPEIEAEPSRNIPIHVSVFAEPNRGHSHPIVAGGRRKMYHVRHENLPFVGSSHEFVGAEQGNTSVSVFLFHGKPGSGPGPHRRPYDEIQFIREGRGLWTVSGKTFEGSAGDIFVIKAGEIHSFTALGDSPLVQVDVHLSPRFIQENL